MGLGSTEGSFSLLVSGCWSVREIREKTPTIVRWECERIDAGNKMHRSFAALRMTMNFYG